MSFPCVLNVMWDLLNIRACVYDHDLLLLIFIDSGMLHVRCEALKFYKLLAQGRSEPVKCDVYKIGLYLVITIELVLHNVKLSHF